METLEFDVIFDKVYTTWLFVKFFISKELLSPISPMFKEISWHEYNGNSVSISISHWEKEKNEIRKKINGKNLNLFVLK